jgi:soluble cytochrome b562
MNKLLDNLDEIDAVLKKGGVQAQNIAGPVVQDVKQILGFSL